jgi:hypothetical protein
MGPRYAGALIEVGALIRELLPSRGLHIRRLFQCTGACAIEQVEHEHQHTDEQDEELHGDLQQRVHPKSALVPGQRSAR